MKLNQRTAFNKYYALQVSSDEIQQGRHRHFVGGMWERLGEMQFDFLRQQGLLPQHKLLDVGCGCLRGGVHFIRYLDSGGYSGLDINAGLLEAAHYEIRKESLSDKKPELIQSDCFAFENFNRDFDFAVAVSVFTHLPFNVIACCLKKIAPCLKKGSGMFFASFFPAPENIYLAPITHEGGIVTHYDTDPFHASLNEYQWLAENTGLRVEYLGDWGHPRGQHMLKFTAKS